MKETKRESKAAAQLKVAVDNGDGLQIGEDLYAVADLLHDNKSLLDALTDPSRGTEAKETLWQSVFGASISGAALQVLLPLSQEHWHHPKDLVKAIEDLGLQSYILQAIRDDDYDQLCQELVDVRAAIEDNRELRVELSELGHGSPEERADLARTITHGSVSPIAERLIVQAAYDSKYGQLLATLRSMAQAVARATGKQLVVAYTAEPLTEAQYDRLARIASQRWDTPVLLTTVTQPDLIGGFRLDAGEQSVDTTVVRDLALAREAMTR